MTLGQSKNDFIFTERISRSKLVYNFKCIFPLFALWIACAFSQGDISYLPILGDVNGQYSGYFLVDEATDSNIFYWFVQAQRNPYTSPLIVWLQGGPGTSSLVGLFTEFGPFYIAGDTNAIKTNPWSWSTFANLLFIDQPVGTGFSFSNINFRVTNETTLTDHLFQVLVMFMERYPQWSGCPLYLFGEGYAGKYIPLLIDRIHKDTTNTLRKNLRGIGIENGWIHPRDQSNYTQFALNYGLIAHNQQCTLEELYSQCQKLIDDHMWTNASETCEKTLQLLMKASGSKNYYDVRQLAQYDNDLIVAYLNDNEVRSSIHALTAWQITSEDVKSHLKSSQMQSSLMLLSEYVGMYNVLLFNGQYDMLCNVINARQIYSDILKTKQYDNRFQSNPERIIWKIDNQVAGYVLSSNNLTFVIISGAGHYVSLDQPQIGLNLVWQFIKGLPYSGNFSYQLPTVPYTFCGEEGWRVWDAKNVFNLCFLETAIMNSVSLFGLIGSIVLQVVHLSKYVPIERSTAVRKFPSIGTCVIFLKITLCLTIGFSWDARLVTHAISGYAGYPMYLALSDSLSILCWSGITSVLYAEWRRRMRHHWFLRLFFIVSIGAAVVKLWSLLNVNNTDPFISNSSEVIPPMMLYCVILGCNSLLCFFGLIGIWPKAAKYLECNHSPLKSNVSNLSWSLFAEFLRVVFGQKLVVLFLIIGNGAAVGVGFFTQYVYVFWSPALNELTTNDLEMFFVHITNIVWCYTAWCACMGVRWFFFGVAAETIVGTVEGARATLIWSLLCSPLTFVENTGPSTIVAHLNNDINKINLLIKDYLSLFFENLSKVIVGTFFMVQLQAQLTCYIMSLVPLMFMISFHQGTVATAYEKLISGWQAKTSAISQDILSKFQSVLIYNKTKYFFEVYCNHLLKVYSGTRRSLFISSMLLLINSFFNKLAFVVSLLLAAQIAGTVNFGDFVVFVFYGEQVVTGMSQVLNVFPKMAEALGSSSKVLELLQKSRKNAKLMQEYMADTDTSYATLKQPPSVTFDRVNFKYEEAVKNSLNSVSLHIPGGSQVALVGPSGSGKSTILRLLCGFLKPTSGEILFNNATTSKMSFQMMARNIAFVPQSSDIFNAQVWENVAFGAWEDSPSFNDLLSDLSKTPDYGEISMSLRSACLAEIDKEKQISDSSNVSVGQQQRISIARAFYKDAKVIVLDEVTSALDQISEQAILDAIEEFRGKATVVMVAHRLHTIQKADIIFVIQNGNIIAHGSHDQLLTSCQLYVDLVNSTHHDVEVEGSAVQYINQYVGGDEDLTDEEELWRRKKKKKKIKKRMKEMQTEEISPLLGSTQYK